MPYTLVAFHAHPDDEALLTGGTLARAAAEGHRVVLVLATDGAAGRTSAEFRSQSRLGGRRRTELARAAAVLGVARVVWLGYDDSGGRGAPSGAVRAFAAADVDEAAAALVRVLVEERADVLLGYDPAGGYGHPDHVQVHRVARRAGDLAPTLLLEATVDRTALVRALGWLHRVPGLPADVDPDRFRDAYSDPALLTHRVDVRAFAHQKQAAMKAHVSQGAADAGVRTLTMLTRLPHPVFRRALGFEWFVERGRTRETPLCGDIFATLRRPAGADG